MGRSRVGNYPPQRGLTGAACHRAALRADHGLEMGADRDNSDRSWHHKLDEKRNTYYVIDLKFRASTDPFASIAFEEGVLTIQNFRDRDTKEIFCTGKSRRFANILSVAVRKLDMLDAAEALNDLRAPPGNRLEPLTGDRAGQHSIRINDQWRICFVWTQAGPTDVEIVDYH